jgi:hypothetical protein
MASIEHHYSVGIPHRRKTMSDDNSRASFEYMVERLLQ